MSPLDYKLILTLQAAGPWTTPKSLKHWSNYIQKRLNMSICLCRSHCVPEQGWSHGELGPDHLWRAVLCFRRGTLISLWEADHWIYTVSRDGSLGNNL